MDDITNDEVHQWIDLSLPMAKRAAQLMQEFRSDYDADTYINAHWNYIAAAAAPAGEYRRLYEQVRNKQAGAEKERKAYDEEIKKLKALRKELDRAIGEV